MTARMLGKVRPSWCQECRRPPGLDCVDVARTTRHMKRTERQQWKRQWRKEDA